jgi:hypothetical protein
MLEKVSSAGAGPDVPLDNIRCMYDAFKNFSFAKQAQSFIKWNRAESDIKRKY